MHHGEVMTVIGTRITFQMEVLIHSILHGQAVLDIGTYLHRLYHQVTYSIGHTKLRPNKAVMGLSKLRFHLSVAKKPVICYLVFMLSISTMKELVSILHQCQI